MYSWGHNGYCQLGNGGSTQGVLPTLVSTNLQGKRVSKVACGSHHSLALTLEGEVSIVRGRNRYCQLGNGGSTQGVFPILVSTNLQGKRVSKVACGSHHSLALTLEGEVSILLGVTTGTVSWLMEGQHREFSPP